MSKINRKLPIALCAVAASAGIALSVTPAASATIGSTHTTFNISCNGSAKGISQNQAQDYGVTVNHQLSGSNQSFAVSVDAQTVPLTGGGYSLTGLSNLKLRIQIDGSAYLSHSLSGGSGYTGTATAVKKLSDPSGYDIIEITIPNVAPGATFTPPTLTVIQTSTVAPKLSTGDGGNGTAATPNHKEGMFVYNPGNFYAFDSTVTGVPLFGTVTAPTSCVPTDAKYPGLGTYPILNVGAGILHS